MEVLEDVFEGPGKHFAYAAVAHVRHHRQTAHQSQVPHVDALGVEGGGEAIAVDGHDYEAVEQVHQLGDDCVLEVAGGFVELHLVVLQNKQEYFLTSSSFDFVSFEMCCPRSFRASAFRGRS